MEYDPVLDMFPEERRWVEKILHKSAQALNISNVCLTTDSQHIALSSELNRFLDREADQLEKQRASGEIDDLAYLSTKGDIKAKQLIASKVKAEISSLRTHNRTHAVLEGSFGHQSNVRNGTTCYLCGGRGYYEVYSSTYRQMIRESCVPCEGRGIIRK